MIQNVHALWAYVKNGTFPAFGAQNGIKNLQKGTFPIYIKYLLKVQHFLTTENGYLNFNLIFFPCFSYIHVKISYRSFREILIQNFKTCMLARLTRLYK